MNLFSLRSRCNISYQCFWKCKRNISYWGEENTTHSMQMISRAKDYKKFDKKKDINSVHNYKDFVRVTYERNPTYKKNKTRVNINLCSITISEKEKLMSMSDEAWKKYIAK